MNRLATNIPSARRIGNINIISERETLTMNTDDNCESSADLDFIEKRGVHREQNGWINENSINVSWGVFGFFIVPESHYRELNYQPPAEELPWRDGAQP